MIEWREVTYLLQGNEQAGEAVHSSPHYRKHRRVLLGDAAIFPNRLTNFPRKGATLVSEPSFVGAYDYAVQRIIEFHDDDATGSDYALHLGDHCSLCPDVEQVKKIQGRDYIERRSREWELLCDSPYEGAV